MVEPSEAALIVHMSPYSIPEDQWSCKRSPDILAYDSYMMFGKGQGNLIYLHLLI